MDPAGGLVIGIIVFVLFLGVWAAFATIAIRKKMSKTIALGGGFIGACVAFIAVTYAFLAILGKLPKSESGASADEPALGQSDEELVQEIWATYEDLPGNRDSRGELHFKNVQVHGQLVKKGTVLPQAMNSSVSERLPAYMACYDYIQVMTSSFGGADSKTNLCIYMIRNPVTETSSLMWRGRDYLRDLESSMAEDGFVGT